MGHYTSPAACHDAILAYRSGDPEPLFLVVKRIAEGLAFKLHLWSQEAEDLISDATIHVITKQDRYTPDRGSAFAFLTTCAFNHMRDRIRNAAVRHGKFLRLADHVERSHRGQRPRFTDLRIEDLEAWEREALRD